RRGDPLPLVGLRLARAHHGRARRAVGELRTRSALHVLGHSCLRAQRMTEPERRNRPSSSGASVPTVLRRKCNDRNASEWGGRGLFVLAVRPGRVFGALKQTVAFGTVDLLGDESATDAAAVQRYDRIGFNVVVPSRISGSTEVRGEW